MCSFGSRILNSSDWLVSVRVAGLLMIGFPQVLASDWWVVVGTWLEWRGQRVCGSGGSMESQIDLVPFPEQTGQEWTGCWIFWFVWGEWGLPLVLLLGVVGPCVSSGRLSWGGLC